MIEYLRGILRECEPTHVVVECGGVGYIAQVTLWTYGRMRETGLGKECRVLTHVQIKEDSHTLWGFAEEGERNFFRLLIGVNGVGTGTARLLLSGMGLEELAGCIRNGDVARLKGVKGIGEKTAMRIVLELKDKVGSIGKLETAQGGKIAAGSIAAGGAGALKGRMKSEATAALIGLGFERRRVESAIDDMLRKEPELQLEDLIRQALRGL